MRIQRGFSLLELSVALIIISLLLGFGMTAGKDALEGSDRVSTQQRMATIQKALDNFARQNGYLPCPAKRSLAPGTSGFGEESRAATVCTAAGDIANVPIAPGTPVIYIGAVPVATLGLPDAYAADAWTNKFLYAVGMEFVGSPTSYEVSDGPITVMYGDVSGTNYAITTDRAGDPGAAAAYVVLSHGPDGKGAYPLNGTAVGKACGATTNNDVANCDDTDATFYDTEYNDGTNAPTFFDDYVVWSSNALSRSELVSPDDSSGGNCLAVPASACLTAIATAASAPDCNTLCSAAGYSSSGPSTTNCTYDGACAGVKQRCDYQCCCTGVPTGGCEAATDAWGGGCIGDVPILPQGGTATIINTIEGFTGTETATCNAGGTGVVAYSAEACSVTSPGGDPGGCSSGNCSNWCAPCIGGLPHTGQVNTSLCKKIITSSDPCEAVCAYRHCSTGACAPCP